MLERLDVHNFRSLRNVRVPLQPLTVLIGANDSGKSSFLAAIQYLINRLPIQPIDFWRGETKAHVEIRGHTSRGKTVVSNHSLGGDEISQSLRPLLFLHLPSQGVRMESSGHHDEQGLPTLTMSGEGVSSVLDYLLRNDRRRFDQVVQAVRTWVPGVQDLLIATPNAANRRLDLLIEGGFRLNGNLASSGVGMLLVFLTIAHHPEPPRIILVEEPETAIHPRRLGEVMGLLHALAKGERGEHPVQVILTTHSPYLLDHVSLETDQVLVFRRHPDGECTAEPANAARLRDFLGEFMLGEIWFNEGEEGLVARK